MTMPSYISKHDTLIIFDMINGKQYVREMERRRSFYTVDDLVDALEDDAIQVLKMIDHQNPDVIAQRDNLFVEDITEECAKAWIVMHQMRDDIEKIRPPYVENSDAWSEWEDDKDSRKPVDMRREYGTFYTQNGSVVG